MVRFTLICNPTARSGRGQRAWKRIRAQLDARQVPYVLLTSEHPGHAVELAREQASRGAEVVVAVGGDGTISEVLEGVMQARQPDGSGSALGILYTGTSPDVCRYHRIPINTDQAILTLLGGHWREVDVGEIRYCRTDSEDPSRAPDTVSWFLCSVNLGMGADVAEGSNRGLRRRWGDTLGTLASLIKTARSFEPMDVGCAVDGKELTLTRVLNLTIGKNPHIASGIRLGIPMACDDGDLYLFAVRGFSLLGFLGQLPRLYQGIFQDHPNNHWCRLRRFECPRLPQAPAIEFDGDPRGFLPCEIRIRPRALRLIVPPGEPRPATLHHPERTTERTT